MTEHGSLKTRLTDEQRVALVRRVRFLVIFTWWADPVAADHRRAGSARGARGMA